MKNAIILTSLFFGFLFYGNTQTGIPVSQMSACDTYVTDFIETHDIPGATFALSKNGKLVYLRAFGHADINGNEITQPHHLFRIASLSKPITSVAIMKMVENGEFSLSDKVFGEDGLLENHEVLASANITDTNIYLITVQNLLEHSAGWDMNTICTPNPALPYTFQWPHCDPIGFPLHVTYVNGTTNPNTEEDLILFLLEKGLDFTPNTSYSYSNTGYLVLGEIIEEISGMSYEEYVKENILAPLGIYDMHIGKNLLEDKMEREGEYTGNLYTTLSCYGTGLYVPWEYGGFNLEAMDAHGGWISSARDIVRLLVAVDGFDTKPDILSQSSIATMVTPSVNNPYYALGWLVNSSNNWWHNGALDGTATLLARTNGGYTWAILLNKRIVDGTSNAFWGDFDALPWNCISSTASFPTHDLMDLPTQNTKSIEFDAIGPNSIDLSWESGDGDERLLVVKENSAITSFPLDGETYIANASFGSGDDLGENTFVVYIGSGNSTTVSGLNPNTSYSFRLFEFNSSDNTGDYPLYMLGDSEEVQAVTNTSTGISIRNDANKVQLFPIPAKQTLIIQLHSDFIQPDFSICDLAGKEHMKGMLSGLKSTLDIGNLPAGFYSLVIREDDYFIRKKFVKVD